MATYQYKGTDAYGKNTKGTIEADSSKLARQRLKKDNIYVFEISERDIAKGESDVLKKVLGQKSVPLNEMTVMTRQLASLIKANIPLVEAVTAVMEQSEHPHLKAVLVDVRQLVNEGSSFSKALGRHPKVFSNIFINMVGAGESSGTLPLVLTRLADFLEAQGRLKTKITSATIYPLLMMVVGGGLMIGIFTFVIPKIGKIFDSMGKTLPWYTQVILNMSDFFVSYWWLVIVVVLGVMGLFRSYIATKGGRARRDYYLLKTPVVGDMVRIIAVSRFASTMSTLLNGGVPIIRALEIAKAVVDNDVLAGAITLAQENISEGNSIAAPLKKSGEFPVLIIHMIAIGERTGDLPHMLEMVAETYEEQVSIKVERFTTLLEPIMIVFMGLAVGVIVMAVFTPLMQLQQLN